MQNQKEEVVLVDKDKLMNFVDSFDKIRNFPVPELSEILGTENAVLKVKGASLDDHIVANNLAFSAPLLVAAILEKLNKGEEFKADTITKMIEDKQVHNNTFFELNLFQKCVIEPELSLLQVLELSEVMPELISRVVEFALGITQNYDRLGVA